MAVMYLRIAALKLETGQENLGACDLDDFVTHCVPTKKLPSNLVQRQLPLATLRKWRTPDKLKSVSGICV